ncbi:MAG TPA: hypothetical protein P5234_10725 [Thermoanaerobaculaceae bacterium]|nr:hypothetical protein [Thermoanaerobaculaceae bacterium]HRS16703.1 hypothetical protein [Thermoanaerobaculaceae bacterium]
MRAPVPRWLLATAVLLAAGPAAGQGLPFLFVEPDVAAPEGPLPAFRPITDSARLERLRGWAGNEAASFAAEVYRLAWRTAQVPGPASTPERLVIAVEPDGASSDVGLRLRDGDGWQEWPRAPFLRLDEDARRLAAVLLHETGHACLTLLSGGQPPPGRAIAPIPHALSALTDRTTAFGEGFAIALEAVLAQRAVAPALRSQFHHDELLFGVTSRMLGEYFRPSAQLVSYAQPQARFQDVRDNTFAFVSAWRGADYLRAQLDPARDFATLRDANQLVQSEGYAASVFYALIMRGSRSDFETVLVRLESLMQAAQEVLRRPGLGPDTPLLLDVVLALARRSESERREVLAVLLDTSRGVLVDRDAAAMWRRHYLAALRQDLDRLELDAINTARARWLAAALADPGLLLSRLGPQLPCVVDAVTISLPGMGVEAPLGFDLNTAEEGVLRAIPGISDAEVARWLAEREQSPFASGSDFQGRVALRPQVAATLRYHRQPSDPR